MAPHPTKRRKLEHDSDEDSIFSNDDGNGGVPSAKESDEDERPSTMQKKKSNNKPASDQTTDNAAMYAGDLYKSSMFKMQVDEMLSELRPNYEKRLGPVNEALRKLKTIIENIPDREPSSVSGFPSKVLPNTRTNSITGCRCHKGNAQIAQDRNSLPRTKAEERCCI